MLGFLLTVAACAVAKTQQHPPAAHTQRLPSFGTLRMSKCRRFHAMSESTAAAGGPGGPPSAAPHGKREGLFENVEVAGTLTSGLRIVATVKSTHRRRPPPEASAAPENGAEEIRLTPLAPPAQAARGPAPAAARRHQPGEEPDKDASANARATMQRLLQQPPRAPAGNSRAAAARSHRQAVQQEPPSEQRPDQPRRQQQGLSRKLKQS